MSEFVFKEKKDITTDWLFYIENEAKSLSQREDFHIDNYGDRELFNPEIKQYLSNDTVQTALAPTQIGDEASSETLKLNLEQSVAALAQPKPFVIFFHKLKAKIKEVFCNVVSSLRAENDSAIDTKKIIGAMLIALVPALGGTGIGAVLLPVIIATVAILLKNGINAACNI